MKWLELQGLSLAQPPLKRDPPAIGLGVSGLGGNRTLGNPFLSREFLIISKYFGSIFIIDRVI